MAVKKATRQPGQPTAKANRRPRGRPRSTRADTAIFRATLELLPDCGLRGLGMEAVARKAGVSKATLYRRFQSKHELVAAALREIRSPEAAPDTGDVRGDLTALARREVSAAGRVPDIARLGAKLLGDAADDPNLLALTQETVLAHDRNAIAEIVRRGIDREELRADLDVEMATDALHGALLYRFLIAGQGLDALRGPYVERLLDTVLAGLVRRPTEEP